MKLIPSQFSEPYKHGNAKRRLSHHHDRNNKVAMVPHHFLVTWTQRKYKFNPSV